jgi:ApeA N-terminal domain 1
LGRSALKNTFKSTAWKTFQAIGQKASTVLILLNESAPSELTQGHLSFSNEVGFEINFISTQFINFRGKQYIQIIVDGNEPATLVGCYSKSSASVGIGDPLGRIHHYHYYLGALDIVIGHRIFDDDQADFIGLSIVNPVIQYFFGPRTRVWNQPFQVSDTRSSIKIKRVKDKKIALNNSVRIDLEEKFSFQKTEVNRFEISNLPTLIYNSPRKITIGEISSAHWRLHNLLDFLAGYKIGRIPYDVFFEKELEDGAKFVTSMIHGFRQNSSFEKEISDFSLFDQRIGSLDKRILDFCFECDETISFAMSNIEDAIRLNGNIEDIFLRLSSFLEVLYLPCGGDAKIDTRVILKKKMKMISEKLDRSDKKTLIEGIGLIREEPSLKYQIQFLFKIWEAMGLKSIEYINQIINIRNDLAHRGNIDYLKYTTQNVADIIIWMATLVRICIFKLLRFSARKVQAMLSNQQHRYMRFLN